MAIASFKGKRPHLAKESFVAPSADVLGRVEVAEFVSIWHGAVIRGDENEIQIGKYANVQDNCVIHVEADLPVHIGEYVTIGHGAIVHGCTIGNCCLIGMNATILDGAQIGEGCIIGAGCLIPPGKIIPPYSQVVGMPGKVVKELSAEKMAELKKHAEDYWQLAKDYMEEE